MGDVWKKSSKQDHEEPSKHERKASIAHALEHLIPKPVPHPIITLDRFGFELLSLRLGPSVNQESSRKQHAPTEDNEQEGVAPLPRVDKIGAEKGPKPCSVQQERKGSQYGTKFLHFRS